MSNVQIFLCWHKRSQDFIWGALFSSKSWRPFLSRLPQYTDSNC